MKLEKLAKSNETKSPKRVGRGPGSGTGKTSGKGHKGQLARSGGGKGPWFEGGQSPLFRRLPKRGFNNARFTRRYAIVNLGDLNKWVKDGDVITLELLQEKKIIKKELNGLKVMGNGELDKKITIKAHRFTQSALQKLENIGGKAEVI
jgi:large subunit ribosomal protein L15